MKALRIISKNKEMRNRKVIITKHFSNILKSANSLTKVFLDVGKNLFVHILRVILTYDDRGTLENDTEEARSFSP